jgi:opacity protein-like surface antigen
MNRRTVRVPKCPGSSIPEEFTGARVLLAFLFVASCAMGAGLPAAAEAVSGQAGAGPPPAAKPASESARPPTRKQRKEGFVGIGIIGGGQLRSWFDTVKNPSATLEDTSGRFMIGGAVQFHLGPRFLIEADAMRRGFGVRSTGSLLGVGFASSSSGTSWEFPVMLKRRFMDETDHVRPFLGAGLSVRHITENYAVTLTSASSSSSASSQGSNSFGGTLGAGLDFRFKVFKISPELRYTLWTADKTFVPVRTTGLFDALPNQIGFIVGFVIN